ncbi:hypothetical protein MPS_4706 [Mycobacterium pseudoshottsii JCM 15466]|nr:hypothetical protein MPS_4706 [Mycobacterium pseudoshottsii JCM 15466]
MVFETRRGAKDARQEFFGRGVVESICSYRHGQLVVISA